MKKPALLALGAALVAIAYPASAWFLGMRIEAMQDEQYRSFEQQPYVKLVSRDFQRGIFSSSETTTIELVGIDELTALAKADDSASSGETPPAEPIRITLRTDFQHGPFPGFSTMAAAVADSELVLTAEQQQQAKTLFGDQKPLQIHSELHLLGGGVSTASSPAFAFDLPKTEDGKGGRASWGGIRMVVDFSNHLQHYTLQADAPGLEITNEQGGLFQMNGLHLEADQQRLFDDEPRFYVGSSKMTLAQLNFNEGKNPEGVEKPAFLLKQLTYDAAAPLNGEFIDLIGKIGVEVAQIGAQNYAPAHYDFSLRHLHARTLANLHRALLQWYADPSRRSAREPAAMLQSMTALRDPALALLKFSPEIRVDRISFQSPQGEAQISASAKLGELKPEELANPFMLLGKLEASADIALPASLLGDTAQAPQIAGLIEQGYVQQDGSMLRSKIGFSKGQLNVNGVPFNPQAVNPAQ
ncbi:YdgA family protein [Quatrionicoccus australiensis]|uniref:YdgA family protein n=1 Tax=Quatrionicoccus australiensis TaxID=138118 RepID=UPI001CFBFB8D|nr:YdgA family protein [Quatrionicoccus australiensis]MCB4361244.1 YdgA family protein [Quatrionicoccus australiensis]